MSEAKKVAERPAALPKRPIIVTLIGMIATILLILATLEISKRNVSTFVSSQQKYILAIEAVILGIFCVEWLVRLLRLLLPHPQMVQEVARLRLIIRIIGYAIALTAVISILASNPTLGISVGAVAGVALAFATQNILSNVIATILLLSTRMVRVGEEITINQTRGIVSDINLTHTILSIDQDVSFVPNSLMVSSIVQRKKRNSGKDAGVHEW